MDSLFNKLIIVMSALSLLTACASKPPFAVEDGVPLDYTPKQAVNDYPESEGRSVVWSGVIVSSENTSDSTQFELLAYPLDSSFQPATNKSPQGRFLGLYPKYVETFDYAPGRLLTLTGNIEKITVGQIGKAEYQFPVVNVRQIHLWPVEKSSDSQFHFGLGVMFSN